MPALGTMIFSFSSPRGDKVIFPPFVGALYLCFVSFETTCCIFPQKYTRHTVIIVCPSQYQAAPATNLCLGIIEKRSEIEPAT